MYRRKKLAADPSTHTPTSPYPRHTPTIDCLLLPPVPSFPLAHQYNMSSNYLHFADRVGFPEADYVTDLAAIGELDQVLETGMEYINLLYTFRSCGRAIPVVTEANKEHKEEIHRKIFEVLRPEIVKLVELKAFVEHVIELFCENLKNMVPAGKKKKVLPEGLFDRLIKVVDLLVKLDNLKDMKGTRVCVCVCVCV